jgi:aryl carrier-like protein
LLDVLLVVGLASIRVANWANVVKDRFLELNVKVHFVVLARVVLNTNKLNVLILLEVSIALNRKD